MARPEHNKRLDGRGHLKVFDLDTSLVNSRLQRHSGRDVYGEWHSHRSAVDRPRGPAGLGSRFKQNPLRPLRPGTVTGSPSVVSNWHFSRCCLLVSSQSMSRNSTKAKAGVGVWHCRQPRPRALTLPDWASACAAIGEEQADLHVPAGATIDLPIVTARFHPTVATVGDPRGLCPALDPGSGPQPLRPVGWIIRFDRVPGGNVI